MHISVVREIFLNVIMAFNAKFAMLLILIKEKQHNQTFHYQRPSIDIQLDFVNCKTLKSKSHSQKHSSRCEKKWKKKRQKTTHTITIFSESKFEFQKDGKSFVRS